jgi:hypothetical protein
VGLKADLLGDAIIGRMDLLGVHICRLIRMGPARLELDLIFYQVRLCVICVTTMLISLVLSYSITITLELDLVFFCFGVGIVIRMQPAGLELDLLSFNVIMPLIRRVPRSAAGT